MPFLILKIERKNGITVPRTSYALLVLKGFLWPLRRPVFYGLVSHCYGKRCCRAMGELRYITITNVVCANGVEKNDASSGGGCLPSAKTLLFAELAKAPGIGKI